MGKHSVELSIIQSGKVVAKICKEAADATGLEISKRKANGLTMKTGFTTNLFANPATIEVSWSEKSSGGSNIKINGSIFGWGPQTGHLRKVVAQYRNEVEQRSNATEMQETKSNISSDPLEKMQKLSQMHEAGLISEEEYNQKKAEILEKM